MIRWERVSTSRAGQVKVASSVDRSMRREVQFEYLPWSADEERDVLAEIDPGELDEEYTRKHAHDYATHAVRTPFVAPKDLVCFLTARMGRWFGHECRIWSTETTTRPAVP